MRDRVQSLQKTLDNEKRDREHAQAHIALLQAEIAVKKEMVIYISTITRT